MRHVPVLLEEVIESLQLKSGVHVIDCTLGDAGHSEAILEKTSPHGKLLGIDADPEAILRAKQFLRRFDERVLFVRDNFIRLNDIVRKESFGPVHGILMDFGWSTPQFEERGRGFSFLKDEPLDMRYGTQFDHLIFGLKNPTAADILNTVEEKELENMFKEYGEEKLSKEIVQEIATYRTEKKIERTSELVGLVLTAYRKKLKTTKEIPWVGGLHPATKVFQALRIVVNDELSVIEQVLPQAVEVLVSGGRLAVITFHSLEDRFVKHYFKKQHGKALNIITKKPIICSQEEYDQNPRARSAKLRVIEKR